MSGILLEMGVGGLISASVVPHVRNTSGKWGGGGDFCVRGTPCQEYFWKMGGGNFCVRGTPCQEYFWKMGRMLISASVVPHVWNTSGKWGGNFCVRGTPRRE